VTADIEVWSASARLFAGIWAPWWVLLQHYCVAIIFHRQVWYRALSLCYACIRSLLSITQSITHPAYLMPTETKHLRFGKS